MFTGLVEELGTVKRVERQQGGGRLTIQAARVLEDIRLGDSISVSGACLTVVKAAATSFVVDCMPETFSRSTLGAATPGTLVNLERSLALGDRLGGHLVLGHVDAVTQVLKVGRQGVATEIRVSLPADLRPYVASKGSVAIDGVSLTVVEVEERSFTVGIIPHTFTATTLGTVKPGAVINIEVDVLARYVIRALAILGAPQNVAPLAQVARRVQGGELTEALLREQGFI